MDVLGWWIWNKYYFWTFTKEIKLEKTSVSAIYGKDGRSKEGTTSKVDTQPQNQLS
jgi:hypothetical protein